MTLECQIFDEKALEYARLFSVTVLMEATIE